ncbi:type II secretion system protein [Hydrogenimonas sp.]
MVTKRPAFTLIELTIVIVILGIVAMISAEIIATIYERYIVSRAVARLETKTELALDQISKRLQYRIKLSTIARKSGGTILPLSSADNSFPILEWIGYDNESLMGDYNTTTGSEPGWSGFVDLASIQSDHTQILSPGSHFSVADGIIDALSDGSIDLDAAGCATSPALYFKGQSGSYDICDYGWSGTFNGSACTGIPAFPLCVARDTTNDALLQILGANVPTALYEQYYLSWSAYALVPELPNGTICSASATATQECSLKLYYDYQPWNGRESYSQNGKSATILDHITTFRFKQTGTAIHIKLCATDAGFNKYIDDNVSVCKERVVF